MSSKELFQEQVDSVIEFLIDLQFDKAITNKNDLPWFA